jgi:hypothetical protein
LGRKSINFTEIEDALKQGVRNADNMIKKKFSKLIKSFSAFRSADFSSDKSE